MLPVMVATLVKVLSAEVSPSLGTKVVVVVGGIVVVGGVVLVVVDVVDVIVELDVVVSTETETLDVAASDPPELQAAATTTSEMATAPKRQASRLPPKLIDIDRLTRPEVGSLIAWSDTSGRRPQNPPDSKRPTITSTRNLGY